MMGNLYAVPRITEILVKFSLLLTLGFTFHINFSYPLPNWLKLKKKENAFVRLQISKTVFEVTPLLWSVPFKNLYFKNIQTFII